MSVGRTALSIIRGQSFTTNSPLVAPNCATDVVPTGVGVVDGCGVLVRVGVSVTVRVRVIVGVCDGPVWVADGVRVTELVRVTVAVATGVSGVGVEVANGLGVEVTDGLGVGV